MGNTSKEPQNDYGHQVWFVIIRVRVSPTDDQKFTLWPSNLGVRQVTWKFIYKPNYIIIKLKMYISVEQEALHRPKWRASRLTSGNNYVRNVKLTSEIVPWRQAKPEIKWLIRRELMRQHWKDRKERDTLPMLRYRFLSLWKRIAKPKDAMKVRTWGRLKAVPQNPDNPTFDVQIGMPPKVSRNTLNSQQTGRGRDTEIQCHWTSMPIWWPHYARWLQGGCHDTQTECHRAIRPNRPPRQQQMYEVEVTTLKPSAAKRPSQTGPCHTNSVWNSSWVRFFDHIWTNCNC
jgi:hypothetical protein